MGKRWSRKAPICSAARTIDSAPADIFVKRILFLFNLHNAHQCGLDGTRARYAGAKHAFWLCSVLSGPLIHGADVSHLASRSAGFSDISPIASQ